MSNIRLIVTDLDGTLIGSTIDFQLFEAFREYLLEYRQRSNSVWAACTGRSLSSTKQFLSPMAELGISPDFIIISHAFIYEHTRLGYLPHVVWNLRMRRHMRRNARSVRKTIDRWYKTITATSLGVVTVYKRRNRLRMRFRTVEASESVERMLESEAASHPYLRVVRRDREVDVFQLPFTKGLAVSELAEHLAIDRGEILTIGDGHNDMSMLDQSVAAFCACPANAASEVMEVVYHNKGHIASKRELAGVVEILECYLENKIRSELPDDWKPEPPIGFNRNMGDAATVPATDAIRTTILFVLVTFTVLLVVAWFGVIPFSGYIIRPFEWVVVKIAELFSFLF